MSFSESIVFSIRVLDVIAAIAFITVLIQSSIDLAHRGGDFSDNLAIVMLTLCYMCLAYTYSISPEKLNDALLLQVRLQWFGFFTIFTLKEYKTMRARQKTPIYKMQAN